MDSRDTASAAFDVASPVGDAAGRGGLARASRGEAAPGDGLHAGQADGLTGGGLTAGGLAAGGGLASRRNGPVPPPTIYDVASAAGVSIASVSRVLNGRGNPLPETRERVLAAVADLGFIPDGAARALSARLKEIIGVVIRRPPPTEPLGDDIFQDEEESLQFPDLINRGIELAAQNRDYNLLVSSVDVDDHDHTRRVFALARKSDGLILHDQVLDSDQLERLSRQVPVVTLAGVATPTTSNVGGDNQGSMRELARHLVREHGYRTLAYLGGHPDSPDNLARQAAFGDEVAAAGGTFTGGPLWQGNYCAAGGARVIDRLLASGGQLPRAIACANDQTALGVVYALMQHGLDVPGDVAVTGFDDIPVARHLRPQLTTVRQPIQELGATAFEVLYSMINDAGHAPRDIVLPTRLVPRESCGCRPDPATPPWHVG
ncbi:MAG: LacI family DNA-binding transcriptional regulator [Streptosporangiaceae bacterium]